MAAEYTPFEVAITAIIEKEGKYLITQRSLTKKRFPGMWTVPGGHLDPADFMGYPKDSEHYWYNVLEKALAREIQEEVGLEIENVRYVTSLATEHKDGMASIVISSLADYKSGELKFEDGEVERAEWVSLEEAKGYELIDGIYDELVMAEALRKGERTTWKRH